MRWMIRLFDGRDASVEAHAVLVLAAFLFLVAFSAYALWKGQGFDAAAYGEAVGIILGGGGAAAVGQSFLRRGANNRPDDPDR